MRLDMVGRSVGWLVPVMKSDNNRRDVSCPESGTSLMTGKLTCCGCHHRHHPHEIEWMMKAMLVWIVPKRSCV